MDKNRINLQYFNIYQQQIDKANWKLNNKTKLSMKIWKFLNLQSGNLYQTQNISKKKNKIKKQKNQETKAKLLLT